MKDNRTDFSEILLVADLIMGLIISIVFAIRRTMRNSHIPSEAVRLVVCIPMAFVFFTVISIVSVQLYMWVLTRKEDDKPYKLIYTILSSGLLTAGIGFCI